MGFLAGLDELINHFRRQKAVNNDDEDISNRTGTRICEASILISVSFRYIIHNSNNAEQLGEIE